MSRAVEVPLDERIRILSVTEEDQVPVPHRVEIHLRAKATGEPHRGVALLPSEARKIARLLLSAADRVEEIS